MKRHLTFPILVLGLVLLLPSFAAADTVAEIENAGDALIFYPVVEYDTFVLTVTGPCNYQYRQVITEGEAIFRLDETTIDGMYRFEMVANPRVDPDIVKVLQQSRAANDYTEVDQLCRDGKLPGAPLTDNSGFIVQRGEIIWDPTAFEKAAERPTLDTIAANAAAGGNAADKLFEKDFVINDDLIVDGSACIGFDCVNGESFGFDTLRLKENNLRIHFDDTSVAASFPRNDWTLVANDSANGGASKFSIEDRSNSRTPFTVEANARSHSLYVDDGGRIGSRTSTPSTEIHTIDGDTPTLRLQQDGSSGFAPQTWDLAGNETNFFVRDVTNGSTLPLRIRPGAPSSVIDISTDGEVGIGTSSPDQKVHLKTGGGENISMRIENNQSSGWDLRTNTTGQFAITLSGSGVNEFVIDDGTGDVTIANNLDVTGDLNVTGTKNFAVPDPTNAAKWLYYSALEGPEAGTYYRGTAKLVDGEVTIELPESFAKLTEAEGMTVQLTPMGGWHKLYVAAKSPNELVVRDAEGGDGIEFDFFVQGVRRGYSDFQVERDAPARENL